MTPHTYINFDKKYKREGRKFLKYKIIAAVAGFLILLAGIFYAVVYSPLFRVTKISIDNPLVGGNFMNNLKDFFVNQSKFTKFLGPDNILIWNAGKLGEFKKGPEIAEINFKKDYTERTVEINVRLRERFGVWCENGLQTTNNEQPSSADAWRASKQRRLAGGLIRTAFFSP